MSENTDVMEPVFKLESVQAEDLEFVSEGEATIERDECSISEGEWTNSTVEDDPPAISEDLMDIELDTPSLSAAAKTKCT